MGNERITENIVRTHFANDVLMNKSEVHVSIKEQADKNFSYIFSEASKKENNQPGYPDFIISFNRKPNFLMVIECKAEISKHESKKRNIPIKYAVDGVIHYMKSINKKDDKINILGIAVSGTNKQELKVSSFLYQHKKIKELPDKELLDLSSYLCLYDFGDIYSILQNLAVAERSIELNKWFQAYSVPETERATFVAAVLLALQDDSFRAGYTSQSGGEKLSSFILHSCEQVLNDSNLDRKRMESVLNEYRKIRNHGIVNNERIITPDGNEDNNRILYDFVKNMEKNIYPLIGLGDKGYDVLGKFFSEFVRHSGSDSGTGLVLTPPHITELFCDIANLSNDDVVYDPCCGTGGFLVAAMNKMISQSNNNTEKIEEIKQSGLIGVEQRSDMFAYSCSNMLMRGDGKSNIFLGDCFSSRVTKNIQELKEPTTAFLNPPYSVSSADQLGFVIHALEKINKGGKCVAIVQTSCFVSNDPSIIEKRGQILDNHTLEAVLSMPDDLFYPSSSVTTCIIVITAKQAHPEEQKTWFGFCKNDEHSPVKKRGRIDKNDKWDSKKAFWLDSYKNKNEISGFSVMKKISSSDQWVAEAYLSSNITAKDDDFISAMREHCVACFYNETIGKIDDNSISNNKFVEMNNSYSPFPLNSLFDFKKGERLNKDERIKGDIPLITSAESNNGISAYIDESAFANRKKIFSNKITIDMLANVYYHSYSYFSDDNIHTLFFRDFIKEYDNPYVCLFIVTRLKELKAQKYSYGRQVRLMRLHEEVIHLPILSSQEPDWHFMENYIKSLPYSSNL